MQNSSFIQTLAACIGAAALTLGASAAQAHGDNLYWSIGVASPGVHVGVSSAPPVVVYPPVMHPAVVLMPPRPVVYAPPPRVVYAPPPGWRHHPHGEARGHGVRGYGYSDQGRPYGGHRH